MLPRTPYSIQMYMSRAKTADLIYLYGDIYGNGYKFDARYVSKNYGTNSFRFRYEKTETDFLSEILQLTRAPDRRLYGIYE